MSDQYDYLADKYDMFMKATPFRPYIEAYTFTDVLGDVSELRVIDLATGSGVYARALAQMGAKEVVGIDVSKEMIALAEKAESDDSLGITFEVGDVTEYQADKPFDLAIAVYLLHYAATREILQQMCDRIASNIVSGGRFVTYTVNPAFAKSAGYYDKYGLYVRQLPAYRNGEKVVVQLKLGDEFTPEITFYRWDKDVINEALSTAGFKDINWVNPRLSPQWDGSQGPQNFFDEYLAIPHALIIECVKS